MEFYTQNLWFAAPLGLFLCVWLDVYIWRENHRWQKLHGNARHPYSPRFTALGVTAVCLTLALLIPWRYVLVVYLAFCVYGGLMWYLHGRRWRLRRNDE